MEIIIIGGCPGEDLSEYVLKNINFGEYNTKKMKDNHKHTKHVYLRFPECFQTHPKDYFDDVLTWTSLDAEHGGFFMFIDLL